MVQSLHFFSNAQTGAKQLQRALTKMVIGAAKRLETNIKAARVGVRLEMNIYRDVHLQTLLLKSSLDGKFQILNSSQTCSFLKVHI